MLGHNLRSANGRNGFSLFEMLIASLLVGIVMGLAIQGFTEAKKLGDMAKSRMVARQEANSAIEKLAKIVRRAHIIFFTPVPLNTNQPNTVTDLNSLQFAALPPLLSSLAQGNTALPWLSPAGQSYIDRSGWGGNTRIRGDFRAHVFNLPAPAVNTGMDTTSPTYLRTAALLPSAGQAGVTPNRFDHFFPGPLLYCAEATLAVGEGDAPERVLAGFPVAWTFYVVYLAPMRIVDRDHGLYPALGGAQQQRDQLPGGRTRAPVPFELRLLTIPDVPALQNETTSTVPPLITRGRIRDNNGVLSPPLDIQQNNAVYDPVPMPWEQTTFNDFNAAPTASGRRIAGTGLHCNWGNLGNEPPSNEVLAAARGRVIDQLLASYIDPDNVHGTCARFGNDWLRDDGPGLLARGEDNPRPYVNATGGPQAFNPQWWNNRNPSLIDPPRRILLSVATRFRYSKQTPFAFATQSMEVELETLNRFQTMAFRERR